MLHILNRECRCLTVAHVSHHTAFEAESCEVDCFVCQGKLLSQSRCHHDARRAAIDESSQSLQFPTSIAHENFVNDIGRVRSGHAPYVQTWHESFWTLQQHPWLQSDPMRLYAVHHRHQRLHCHPFQTQFRFIEPLPSGKMQSETDEFFGCWLSKDFCRLIWCHPSLFGPRDWSFCSGLPRRENLGQIVALWFGDPHCKHLPIELRLSKMSVEIHSAGVEPDNCPPPPDLPCFFDPAWPDWLPVMLAGSEMKVR